MNHVLKGIDFVVNLIGGGSMYASIVMLMGGEIKLPWGFEIGILPSLVIAIPFALYQAARAHSMYHKTMNERREKEQELRIKKYETDQIISGYLTRIGAVNTSKTDFKELTEIEEKHRQEIDDFLTKKGYKS